jgi:mRNA-degrading endonuclease toxin of MazEF toxin-antitoxin module
MDAASPPARGIAVWDIVRVDFPFADEARTRRRPGLVAAIPAVHGDFAVLWVMMITSAPGGKWPFDVSISDLRLGGLDHACMVRVSKITVLDARLAVRIGELAEMDRVNVRESLRAVLKDAFGE